jgi:hypothetical protein
MMILVRTIHVAMPATPRHDAPIGAAQCHCCRSRGWYGGHVHVDRRRGNSEASAENFCGQRRLT